MTIAPIPTRYAGCRFRSRLEARWAVFFNHLGIKWEYEPQGYVIGPYPTNVTSNGVTLAEKPYLPDFWLPTEKLWVEVKGGDDGIDHELLLNAAIPNWGLPGGRGVLVLGPVPDPDKCNMHACLTFDGQDVHRDYAAFQARRISIHNWLHLLGPNGGAHVLGNVDGDLAGDKLPDLQYSLASTLALSLPREQPVGDAYTAARSARFEHGESP